MPLNPNFEFDRVIAGANEAERRQAAEKPLAQYERGIITLDELVAKLIGITETIDMTRGMGEE